MDGAGGKRRGTGPQCSPGEAARRRVDRRNSGRGPGWRHEEIELAAYFNAERRGFKGNQALEDWLEAERYIDTLEAGDGGERE
jgi:hypothetical protein